MIFFKFPFLEKIYTIEEKRLKEAVSFTSFNESETLHFPGNIVEISKEDFLSQKFSNLSLNSGLEDFKVENEKDYLEKISNVIQFIKDNQLSKLVISRRKLLDLKKSEINFAHTFLNLSQSYPNAFVYFFTRNDKCWMGAFSEILGNFDKKTSSFETMSLAGTLPLNEDWTKKEIDEQKHVTHYISKILQNFTTDLHQSDTFDHISGNIKHLRTDFKARIKKENLEKLIAELHPTPAVCGIPKDFCKSAIAEFEDHNRSFYAGYIKVETETQIRYFVNLRCAEFFSNAGLIYVGGGITAESSPEKEWRETELKAEAVLKNIAYV